MGVTANSDPSDDAPEPSGDPSPTSPPPAGAAARPAGPADASPGGGGPSERSTAAAADSAGAAQLNGGGPIASAREAARGKGDGPTPSNPSEGSAAAAADGPEPDGDPPSGASAGASDAADGPVKKGSRRFPAVTTDTARPEGGGRAAPGDAPAPARQWPLLTVLLLAGAGLLIVGIDAFADSFRIGTILVGVALLAGAVMRRVVPSVGMLAVRSRFTDMVTYGLLGTVIVLLALVTQPKPWLDVPFLEDAVHFTVR
ncbi:DUF3017 domain-containing protein [Streptomyces sp. PR69]|uniref:DUF3017 domain-containing protein n=1 Tax=Streptomyces sp. PR69 TaxID=2984950 RepID=UPI002264FD76|nr:DUF3017 domain-containing protein [Streptomyces sp. PR69]